MNMNYKLIIKENIKKLQMNYQNYMFNPSFSIKQLKTQNKIMKLKNKIKKNTHIN